MLGRSYKMKKEFGFVLVFVLFFGFANIDCNAQSSNNMQRLVGTWIDHKGSTWIFNSDGSISSSGRLYNNNVIRYSAI
jgi:hypothetical protein